MKHSIPIVVILSLVFTACKKEELPAPDSNTNLPTENYTSVRSIIESSCLGCHSMSQNAYIPDYTSYTNVKNYLDQANNTFIDRLNSDDEFYRMPPSGSLPESDKNKLISWINNGYPE